MCSNIYSIWPCREKHKQGHLNIFWHDITSLEADTEKWQHTFKFLAAFYSETQKGWSKMMLSGLQPAVGIMSSVRNISKCVVWGKSLTQTDFQGRTVSIAGENCLSAPARSSTSSLISSWGLKMDYKHPAEVDPFLWRDGSTHTSRSERDKENKLQQFYFCLQVF